MQRSYPILRSDNASVRLPVRLGPAEPSRANNRHAQAAVWLHARRAVRGLFPALFALSLASVAHAQGTMDFSGAQTLMATFKTFAMYAGAVICLGGPFFAGIRMMSGRFQVAIPGLFGVVGGQIHAQATKADRLVVWRKGGREETLPWLPSNLEGSVDSSTRDFSRYASFATPLGPSH